MAGEEERPIIIKKVKKGGHGHHGGAWKVAYADFVTAMMAFFLLLWLLAATDEDVKKGIADYFTPTIGVKGALGIGVEGGLSPSEDGTSRAELFKPGIIAAAPDTGTKQDIPQPVEQQFDGEQEEREMEVLGYEIKKALSRHEGLGRFRENLMIEQTEEGLKIQLIDKDDQSMFKPGSAQLRDHTKEILKLMAPILNKMPNRMSLSGHTDSEPFGRTRAYTNWELSADRANSARRFLVNQTELEKGKIVMVTGKADKEPLIPQDRMDPRNRRLTMVLLHRHVYPFEVPASAELLKPGPDSSTPSTQNDGIQNVLPDRMKLETEQRIKENMSDEE